MNSFQFWSRTINWCSGRLNGSSNNPLDVHAMIAWPSPIGIPKVLKNGWHKIIFWSIIYKVIFNDKITWIKRLKFFLTLSVFSCAISSFKSLTFTFKTFLYFLHFSFIHLLIFVNLLNSGIAIKSVVSFITFSI